MAKQELNKACKLYDKRVSQLFWSELKMHLLLFCEAYFVRNRQFPNIQPVILFNTLRPRQNGCLFADDIFKRIFLNENVWISITISLKFVPKGPMNNIPALVQIMAWHRPGDKPLSEPMLVGSMTHICVTRPQWVNLINFNHSMNE